MYGLSEFSTCIRHHDTNNWQFVLGWLPVLLSPCNHWHLLHERPTCRTGVCYECDCRTYDRHEPIMSTLREEKQRCIKFARYWALVIMFTTRTLTDKSCEMTVAIPRWVEARWGNSFMYSWPALSLEVLFTFYVFTRMCLCHQAALLGTGLRAVTPTAGELTAGLTEAMAAYCLVYD